MLSSQCLVFVCLALLATVHLSCCEEPFDGVIRPSGNGTYQAYMVPPFKSNHASFLEILPSGELTLAWFSGSAEGESDVAIVFTRLAVNSTQWLNATVVSRRDGYSNQNPVLFFDKKAAALHLFHSQQKADKGESEAEVWELVSADGRGLKWTEPKATFSKPGTFDRNRMVLSLSGAWMLPMYVTSKCMVGFIHRLFLSRVLQWTR